MAESAADFATYAGILHNLQSHWPEYDGHYRQWYKDVVTVFIGSFVAPDDANHDELDGWVGMGANQLAQAINAFRMWDELIGITISFTSGNEGADITFAYSTSSYKNGTYASPTIGDLVSEIGYGSYAIEGEEIWMSADGNWSELTEAEIGSIGGQGFATFLHEIGHALGLSHPGSYNADDDPPPDYGDDAVMPQDSGQYTIMSYFGAYYDIGYGWGPPDDDIDPSYVPSGNYVYWQTPTIYDIAALQEKYGVELTTRADDTTYGYNASGVGVWSTIYDFTNNTTPLITIYDAGGIDTIDLSDYAAGPQVIDLTPGSYSDVLGMINNLAVAYGTIIENVIGGGGADTIIGNSAANTLVGNAGDDTIHGGGGDDSISGGYGNDHLYGGAGADTIDGGYGRDHIDGGGAGDGVDILTGGIGDDIFVYSAGYRRTEITDFNALTFDEDRIDVSLQRLHSFTEILAAARQVGGDVVIDFGGATTGPSDALTLRNFNIDDLDPGMFIFSENEISPPGDFQSLANPEPYTGGIPFRVVSAALGDGGFLSFETSAATLSTQTIVAHRFDARGVETGTFKVNTVDFGTSGGANVRTATLPNGNIVVVWESNDTGGGGIRCIRARLYDPEGQPLGDDFVVNGVVPLTQTNGAEPIRAIELVTTPGGGFIVQYFAAVGQLATARDGSWMHAFQAGFDGDGVRADADVDLGYFGGPPPGPPTPINLNSGRTLTLEDGSIFKYWQATDSEGDALFAQVLGHTGVVRISSDSYVRDGAVNVPWVNATQLSDGNIAFTWAGGVNAGSFNTLWAGTRMLIVDTDLSGFVRPGTAGGDLLMGGTGNDRLYGLDGDDTIIGGRGADLIDGGDGIDLVDYDASLQGVTISLGLTGGQSGGHAEGDVLVSVENVRGSAYADVLIGNGEANRLIGGYGNDTIHGGGGDDVLEGGRGEDTLVLTGLITDYAIIHNTATDIFIFIDDRPGSPEGVDTVHGFEFFRFDDGKLTLADLLAFLSATEDHPVTPGNDFHTVAAGSVLVLSAATGLLANDEAPDGGAVVTGVNFNGNWVMSMNDPTRGSLVVQADGSLTFTPAAGFEGVFTVDYRVEDSNGSWAGAVLEITVEPPPVDAIDDIYATARGQSVIAAAVNGLLANDVMPAGGATVVGIVADDQPVPSYNNGEGTLSVSADGAFTFTPMAGFTGITVFAYRVVDANGKTDEATVRFEVSGDNLPPSNIALSNDFVLENRKAGTLVGTFSAEDANGDRLTYTLVDDAGGLFRLQGRNLVTNTRLNHEARSEHMVQLSVSDGEDAVLRDFMIQVGDINEAPFRIRLDHKRIAENQRIGTEVGTFSAVDPEGGALRWRLVDNPGKAFRIDGDTLETNRRLNFEDTRKYHIEVKVIDEDGNSAREDFTIRVRDLPEHKRFHIFDMDGHGDFLFG